MTMALCPNCGSQIQPGLTVCMSCRGTVGGTATMAESIPQAAIPAEHSYFPIATHKFVALSFFTMGLYDLYWCYHQWRRIRARTGDRSSPFWRAFFAPLWAYSLFRVIRDDAQSRGVAVSWKAGLLGILYFLLCGAWRLPDAIWLISLGSFVPFIPVVQTIQGMNATERAAEGVNDSYSGVNIVTLIVGGLFVLLAIIGTFVPA